ncbi:MAG TPA: hypothetical protein VN181_13795, partial [Thermoanaerobaculia bacterium]|nr:hypothetical protein [Thermoanaerobaculia bacterium]
EDSSATVTLKDLTSPTPVATPNLGGVGAYDPATPNAQIAGRVIRGKIRAFRVRLVGMNAVPDAKYVDTADTIAPNYRKYELTSTIQPRNLGLTGLAQSSANPPDPATIESVCIGYCGVAVVKWKPAAGTVDTSYKVLWDTSPTGTFSHALPAGDQNEYAVDLTQEDLTQDFYFKVAAANNVGVTMSTNTISTNVRNATKPDAPSAFSASISTAAAPIPGEVRLTWDAPTTNASGAPTCSPISATPSYPGMVAGELKGYNLYRSTDPNFRLTDTGVVKLLNGTTAGASSDGLGTWFFSDTAVSNCTDYYYRIEAVEWCNARADYNDPNNTALGISAVFPAEGSPGTRGYASSGVYPKKPVNLTAAGSSCSFATNRCNPIRLTWDRVTQDTANNPLTVSRYKIYRQRLKNNVPTSGPSGIDTLVYDMTGAAGITPTVTWSDGTADDLLDHDTDGVQFSYQYHVTAYSCGDGVTSDPVMYPNTCFSGAVITATGSGAGNGTATNPWVSPDTLQLSGGTGIASVYVSVDGAAATPLSS